MRSLIMKPITAAIVGVLSLAATYAGAQDATQAPAAATLFQNVRIFDGKSATLSASSNVLVRGNIIERISIAPIPTDRRADTRIIDGGGRTLMPGLIDAHAHMAQSVVPQALIISADPNYTMLRQGKAAGEMLLRGFTSARDLSGPTFGLKRAIDEGHILGPRIWPAGAAITQTSGHADFRTLQDLPRGAGDPPHFTERLGYAAISDGPAEVLRRAREQLMLGASHLKLMAGGGVASNFDPLDVTQFTEAEIRSAVEAAENWGTYVTVHAYTPRAIQQAIRAGVKCIEHGQLADEASAKMMAEKGIWWSLQPFLDDEDAIPFPEGSANRKNKCRWSRGPITPMRSPKNTKSKRRSAPIRCSTPSSQPARARNSPSSRAGTRRREVLKMATADNGEVLALSGLRSPYPGKLGVVEEGAHADLRRRQHQAGGA